METEIKIITLNCWGIPCISKDRRTRMVAIAEMLACSDYDVVCLQEVWSDADFNLLRTKASGSLPYSHYFYSGVVGSGVCVLSRHYFQDVFFHQWAINGYVHKLQHGDWWGGKGVGMCRIKVNGFNVNIYAAHLHAEYDKNCDEYLAHRVLQAYDTAQFIQLTSGAADLVVLAGDLNSEPEDLAYSIIIKMASLVDSQVESGEAAPENCATHESLRNSYTPSSHRKNNCPGERIDYIMYRPGLSIKAHLKSYEYPLPDRVPNQPFSYSDHEAIAVTVQLVKCKTCACGPQVDKDGQRMLLTESIQICEAALRRLVVHKRVYWLFSFILLGLLVATVVTNPPFGYPVIYHILRLLLTGVLCFTLIMATLWNGIEKHAVLSGKLTMEASKFKLEQRDCRC